PGLLSAGPANAAATLPQGTVSRRSSPPGTKPEHAGRAGVGGGGPGQGPGLPPAGAADVPAADAHLPRGRLRGRGPQLPRQPPPPPRPLPLRLRQPRPLPAGPAVRPALARQGAGLRRPAASPATAPRPDG